MNSRAAQLLGSAAPWLIWVLVGLLLLLSFDALPFIQVADHWYAAPGYVLPAVLHALYGIGLFVLILVVGAGALLAAGRYHNLSSNDISIAAIPTGVIVLGAFSMAIGLLDWWGKAGSLIVCSVLFHRAFTRYSWPRLDLSTVVLVCVVAIGFGCHMAFVWRPGTLEYPGGVDVGDMTVYANYYFSLKQSIWPFIDLAVEGETNSTYFNTLFTFVALLLDSLPGFDIFLFHTATVTTLYPLFMYWVFLMMQRFRREEGLPELSVGPTFLIATLVILASRYPSWIVETPPAVLMGPVALATGYLVIRAGASSALLAYVSIFALIGSAVSKVVSVCVLGGYAGFEYLRSILIKPKAYQFAVLIVVALLVLSYGFYLIREFGSFFQIPEMRVSQQSAIEFINELLFPRRGGTSATIGRCGLMLIVVGILIDRNWPLAMAGVVGLAGNFAYPFLFTPTPAAILLLLCARLTCIERSNRGAMICFWAGALMMLPYHIRIEKGGESVYLLWSLTMIAITLLSAKRTWSALRRKWNVIGILSLCFASIAAVAAGKIRLGNELPKEVIEPELHQVWVKTRELTDSNGLIFTDQTGPISYRLSGWNDYATLAERQFFLVSWQGSSLRYDESRKLERLETNDQVLSGALDPGHAGLSRCYSAYYGVVAADRRVPDGFSLVFSNESYAIYEIESSDQDGCAS